MASSKVIEGEIQDGLAPICSDASLLFRLLPDKLEPQDEAIAIISEVRPTPGRPPKPSSNSQAKKALGPSLHLKPYSQSYGVGLAEGVMAGGWLEDAGSSLEAGVGEGGAKRGEYEVCVHFSNADLHLQYVRNSILHSLIVNLTRVSPLLGNNLLHSTGFLRRRADGHVA